MAEEWSVVEVGSAVGTTRVVAEDMSPAADDGKTFRD